MKKYKVFVTVILLLGFSTFSVAQKADLLDSLPTTKEGFIASEKNVLATIDWLENTPIDQETNKRKAQSALLLAWLINTPTVTIEFNAAITNFNKKNADLLTIFMGGWTRYTLQNNYSKDVVMGSLAGIKAVTKAYKTGQYKKDKEVQKLVEMEEKGELEDWVKKKLAK
jgi:hypothetical protein